MHYLLSLSFFWTGVVTVVVGNITPLVWYREDYPSPQSDVEQCGRRGKTSWVCDPNGLLSNDEADELDNIIIGIINDTECPCQNLCIRNKKGYRVSIALLKKMKPQAEDDQNDVNYSMDQKLQMAKMFAYTLEEKKWSFGQCDEDVVLVFSADDNVVYTMTGDVARYKLKGNLISEITMAARMKLMPGKDLFEGLQEILLDYKKVFLGKYVSTAPTVPPPAPAPLRDSALSHQVALSTILTSLISVLLTLLF